MQDKSKAFATFSEPSVLITLTFCDLQAAVESDALEYQDVGGFHGGKSCLDDAGVPRLPYLQPNLNSQRESGGMIESGPRLPLQGTVAAWITPGIGPIHQSDPIKSPVANAQVLVLSTENLKASAVDGNRDLNSDLFTDADGSYAGSLPTGTLRALVSTDFVSQYFRARSFLPDTGTLWDCPDYTSQCWGIYREFELWPTRGYVDFFLADNSIEYPKGWTENTIASSNAFHHVEASIRWVREVFPNWLPPSNLVVTANTRMARCNAFYSRSVHEITLLEATEGFCPNASYSP